MAEIKCPMCGKPNPAELEVCQYCEARLKPLTDELSRSQPPIHPGDEPTEQDTGQLEPILPQWLREVRQQARDSVEDDESAEQVPAEEDTVQPEPEEPADLLAGLQSQSEEDDEIPDWLAGLRGEAGQVAEDDDTSSEEEDDDLAALKSMLGEETPAQQESEAGDLPGWISDLSAEETTDEKPAQAESQPPESDSDFEWGADFESDSAPQIDSTKDEAALDAGLPAWLQGADETETEESESFPSAGITAEEPAQVPESEDVTPPAAEGDLPDWLASLGEEDPESDQTQDTEQLGTQSTTDWLSSLGEEDTEETPAQEAPQPVPEGDVPDWITSLGEADSDEERAAAGDIPEWASSSEEESSEDFQKSEPQLTGEGDLPDWLSSLGDEKSEELSPTAETPETPQPVAGDEMPDWLSSMGDESTETEQVSESIEASTAASEEPVGESVQPSPIEEDEGEPISTEDVESIFTMDMPDWLSDTEGEAEGDTETAALGATADELDPGELPSWVQAMRPVESVISETEGEPVEDQPLEKEGPLAGLRGVLPAVPGVGPSSTPKAYSIKLQASEEQQANASMLEQMLAEEIHPKAVSSQKAVSTQRILRWVITALIVLIVGGTIFSGTQINQMPTSAPPETSAVLNFVRNILPADAPVLMIFDYEAALAGELEASAAPLIDLMLTLKAPRLSMISSTPTGTGLAERFIEPFTRPDNHNYQRGDNFINLGYLPGGAAGVLAFSENPVGTKPLATDGVNAWETPVLGDVDNLSEFAAIILLTNDIETARIWIEQTENTRDEARLLVVSSAQSGPMIQPYYQSGQVDGLVNGLNDSAPIEQTNSGRPGVARRYWDAYGFGLLAATTLIVLGSLWSLFSGWQANRKKQGEG